MKKSLLFFGSLFLSSIVSAQSDLPNPCSFNCGSGDRTSPWNFHEDFEDSSWSSNLSISPTSKNSGGVGTDRFVLQKETNGNQFLSITVKHGWGKDSGSKGFTERSEVETSQLTTFKKEVWYGFRIKTPPNNPVLFDRVLFTQFKHRTRTKPSPMICIYQYGPKDVRVGLSICGKSGGRGEYQTRSSVRGLRPFLCNSRVTDGSLEFNPTLGFKEFLTENWSTVIIGSYVTNGNDGFVKIYFNKDLIYDYQGPTYGWSKIVGSEVRIGIYRDGGLGEGYPDQTVHYDDFVIGSTKEEISSVLWN